MGKYLVDMDPFERQRAIEQAQRDLTERDNDSKRSNNYWKAMIDVLAKRFAVEAKANRAKVDAMLAEVTARLAANDRTIAAQQKSLESLIRMSTERAVIVAWQRWEADQAAREALESSAHSS